MTRPSNYDREAGDGVAAWVSEVLADIEADVRWHAWLIGVVGGLGAVVALGWQWMGR